MKYLILSLSILCLSISSLAQSLGGFPIADYLVSAVHPDGCSSDFITGLPTDSIWVNFGDNVVMTGDFGSSWSNGSGDDLLLETGFHPAILDVRLILAGGLFSSTHSVFMNDWTEIEGVVWNYVFTACNEGSGLSERYVLPLDFESDFGLLETDVVEGIEINFQFTDGLADLAGVYIIGEPCANSSSTIDVVECDSYVSPSGEFTWDESGIYNDVIPNAIGCDSLMTINLTINNSIATSDVYVVCDSLVWIDGMTYDSNNNSASVMLQTTEGCDSLVTLDLTILEASSGIDTQTACDTFTWIDGETYTESNNTATYTLVNAVGCDSLVTLDLSMLNSTSGVDQQVACDTFTWIDGIVYEESNNSATYVLTNSVGCDSVVTLNLTINSVSSMVTQDGSLLTADEIDAEYQWLLCPDFEPIEGATEQSFEASSSGDYAVMVSLNGCSETSDCFSVEVIGVEENLLQNGAVIYPNPVKDAFTITLKYPQDQIQLSITDASGRLVESQTFLGTDLIQFNNFDHAPGMYLVVLQSENGQAILQLVKE